jgi:integrase
VHPSIVANQLGHASVKTTLDIYSHSIPALQEAAAIKFDDIVIGKKSV